VLVVETVNPRQFATDVHRTVDDRPYGGGPGMVLKAEPLRLALDEAMRQAPEARRNLPGSGWCAGDAAQGAELSGLAELVLVAGRYEQGGRALRRGLHDESLSVGESFSGLDRSFRWRSFAQVIRQSATVVPADATSGSHSQP